MWGLVALVVLGVTSQAALATGTLDSIGDAYKTASSGWESTLAGYAKSLFLKLALLEILWFVLMKFLIAGKGGEEFLGALIGRLLPLLFFYAILLNFDTWVPYIIDSFSKAGQTASGTTALTPSAVVDTGLKLAGKILSTGTNLGLLSNGSIGAALSSVLASIGIVIAFAVIAGQLLVTLIESYIVVSAGVLFLGFAGSSWTKTFAEKFLSYCASVGTKLFMTYLIIGVGQSLASQWVNLITANMVATDYLSVFMQSLVYLFIAWQVPSMASSMLTGGTNMTLGGMGMAAAGMVAGGALGGAVVAGGAGALAKGAGAAGSAAATGLSKLGSAASAGFSAAADGMGANMGDMGRCGSGSGTGGGSSASLVKGLGGATSTGSGASSSTASGGLAAPSAPGSDAGSGDSVSPPSSSADGTSSGTPSGSAGSGDVAAPSGGSTGGGSSGDLASPTAGGSSAGASLGASSRSAGSGDAAAPSGATEASASSPVDVANVSPGDVPAPETQSNAGGEPQPPDASKSGPDQKRNTTLADIARQVQQTHMGNDAGAPGTVDFHLKHE